MVGVLEAVVATIALAEALEWTARRASELYKAPAEITALQKHLEALSATLHTVSGVAAAAEVLDSSSELSLAVAKTGLAVQELHQLITKKLLGPGDTRIRSGRTRYLLNRRQIIRLQKELKSAREELYDAVAVESLLCNSRIEANLTVFSIQSTGGVDQYSWSRTTVASTANHHSVKWAASVGPNTLCYSQSGDDIQDHLHSIQLERTMINSFRRAGPASPFELRSSMRPEDYTTANNVPSLFAYFSRQISADDCMQVAQYSILYRAQTSFRWIRLVLTVKTSIESAYWLFGRCQSDVTYSKGIIELLRPIATALHKSLLACHDDGKDELVGQDRHLSIYLGSPANDAGVQCVQRILLKPPCDDNIAYLHMITARVRHWNCPRYQVRELIHRPESSYRPNNRFLAFVKPFWACETLFGPDMPRNKILFNELQILNAVGRPGVNQSINPFLGLVFDGDNGLISGFLTAIPAKGFLSRLMISSQREGCPISWKRRVKWCRQIVEGVSVIHAADKVIGCLGDRPEAKVSIDANDNAVLWGRFLSSFVPQSMYPGATPPEIADDITNALSGGPPVFVTPEADVYQMGLLLWGIATCNPRTGRTDFCRIAGCSQAAAEFCDQAHADPLQLPLQGLGIPQWLQSVITTCRAEVQQRPSAYELLEIMDAHDDTERHDGKGKRESSSSQIPRRSSACCEQMTSLDDALRLREASTSCSICDLTITPTFYKCNTCHIGDFDLCSKCFDKGWHCDDPDEHYLRRERMDKYTVEEKGEWFFSAVRGLAAGDGDGDGNGEGAEEGEQERGQICGEEVSAEGAGGKGWVMCAGGRREVVVLS